MNSSLHPSNYAARSWVIQSPVIRCAGAGRVGNFLSALKNYTSTKTLFSVGDVDGTNVWERIPDQLHPEISKKKSKETARTISFGRRSSRFGFGQSSFQSACILVSLTDQNSGRWKRSGFLVLQMVMIPVFKNHLDSTLQTVWIPDSTNDLDSGLYK